MLSRYQYYANEHLLTALKRILRYVKGTLNYKLVFRTDSNLGLVGYVDADWGGDCNDRKSTTGYCFKLFNCTISWCSKKQNCVALSSTEAEYVALCAAVTEACWLKNLLFDFNISDICPIKIYEDNQSAIKVANNAESKRLKHIDIKYHFVRDMLCKCIIEINYIKSEDQIGDMFTKPLSKELLCKFKNCCGIV